MLTDFMTRGYKTNGLNVFSIKFGKGKLTKEKVSIYKVTPVTHPLVTYQVPNSGGVSRKQVCPGFVLPMFV